ncbi:hypothetical protein TELCIR_11762 [Teladorsagia circumcincta]|uniref:CMP domain-containing protein n=1 Tax=Teladorsagia circumcincta TaxID=45464 RepID=A0A2G9U8J2_TELCI|nr:hypothetical protein TELCIR_11762 [Teladorsagia circumcincta]
MFRRREQGLNIHCKARKTSENAKPDILFGMEMRYRIGLVQVNNWKALPFEQITDNPDETVHSLFKDISGHITLRILTKP